MMPAATIPEAVHQWRERLARLEADNQELRERLAALEARPDLRYLGVWQEGVDYRTGNLVTWRGSLWHADEDTDAKPGQGNAWTLAVKRGGNR